MIAPSATVTPETVVPDHGRGYGVPAPPAVAAMATVRAACAFWAGVVPVGRAARTSSRNRPYRWPVPSPPTGPTRYTGSSARVPAPLGADEPAEGIDVAVAEGTDVAVAEGTDLAVAVAAGVGTAGEAGAAGTGADGSGPVDGAAGDGVALVAASGVPVVAAVVVPVAGRAQRPGRTPGQGGDDRHGRGAGDRAAPAAGPGRGRRVVVDHRLDAPAPVGGGDGRRVVVQGASQTAFQVVGHDEISPSSRRAARARWAWALTAPAEMPSASAIWASLRSA